MRNWDPSAELYTINLLVGHPSLDKPGNAKVVFTNMLGNKWRERSCFHETTPAPVAVTNGFNGRGMNGLNGVNGISTRKVETASGVRTFKWKHDMGEVHKQSDEHGAGCDGFELREGNITVTALRANFEHAELSARNAQSFTV